MKAADLWEHAATVAIVACGVVLSIVWALSVPIFENPDEAAHFDYVLGIRTAGRLLLAREGRAGMDDNPSLVYLVHASGLDRIAFHPAERAPQDYGSTAWIAQVDRSAPAPDPGRYASPQHPLPELVTTYPPGYYALAAIWMAAAQQVRPGLVEGFFSVRFFTVFVFGLMLLSAASLMRELRIDRPTRLLVLAALALFPLSSFLSASVQPDVLVGLILTVLVHRSLLYRRAPTLLNAAAIAALLVAGCLVKPVYMLPGVLTFATLLTGMAVRRPGLVRRYALHGALGLVGFALAYELDRIVSYQPPRLAAISIVPIVNTSVLREALSHGPLSFAGYVASTIPFSIKDFFFDGGAQVSYWGQFGWLDTPLRFRTGLDLYAPSAAFGFRIVVALLGALTFALVAWRCAAIAKRGSAGPALALFFNDPALTLLLAYDALMLGIAVAFPTLGYQGRYWFPVIVVSMIASVRYGARLVPFVGPRVGLQRGFAVALCAWSVIASQAAAHSIHLRYYASSGSSPAMQHRSGLALASPSRPHRSRPGALPATAAEDPGPG